MVGIASLLEQDEYRVPIYQRSYAWEAVERREETVAVEDFWTDLKDALNSGEPDYFLGSVVLTPSEEDKRLTIIDGQQRLATTSLLLAALRDLWQERGEPAQADDVDKYLSTYDRRARDDVPRLMLNQDDDAFYRALVVQPSNPSPSRDSHERLRDAYAYLKERLDADVDGYGRKAEDRLLNWLDFLDRQVVVITVEVPTEADAFVIFETLNDRGMDLTIGDLLKNYLFMRAGSRLEAVKSSWVAALTALDVSAENENFVRFLRHYWSSRYGATRERGLYASVKKQITSPAQAVAHASDLADAAKDYAALESPSHEYWKRRGFTTTTSTNVDILLRLELEQNRPLLLAVMKYFTKADTKDASGTGQLVSPGDRSRRDRRWTNGASLRRGRRELSSREDQDRRRPPQGAVPDHPGRQHIRRLL